MITDYNIKINEYGKMILENYGIWKYKCPCCGAKNSLNRHATYLRYICIPENCIPGNQFQTKQIKILRLKCTSCGKTHAILPAGTIPYSYYSFTCVMEILIQYYQKQGIITIAQKHDTSTQIIYYYIAKYISQMASCINFLRSYLMIDLEYNTSPGQPLEIISKNFTYISFLKQYFIQTNQIFLMTRRRGKIPIGM